MCLLSDFGTKPHLVSLNLAYRPTLIFESQNPTSYYNIVQEPNSYDDVDSIVDPDYDHFKASILHTMKMHMEWTQFLQNEEVRIRTFF